MNNEYDILLLYLTLSQIGLIKILKTKFLPPQLTVVGDIALLAIQLGEIARLPRVRFPNKI